MLRATTWMAAALGVAIVACAPKGTLDPSTVQRMSQIEQTIAAAQRGGADRDPRAARHLALARDHVEQAQQLGEGGDRTAANRMLERAAVDAELARALSQETRVRRDAERIQARIETLQRSSSSTPTQNTPSRAQDQE